MAPNVLVLDGRELLQSHYYLISVPSPASGVLINDDASHVLVFLKDGKTVLDGLPIDLGTSVGYAEVVGSTVYAYVFVQAAGC